MEHLQLLIVCERHCQERIFPVSDFVWFVRIFFISRNPNRFGGIWFSFRSTHVCSHPPQTNWQWPLFAETVLVNFCGWIWSGGWRIDILLLRDHMWGRTVIMPLMVTHSVWRETCPLPWPCRWNMWAGTQPLNAALVCVRFCWADVSLKDQSYTQVLYFTLHILIHVLGNSTNEEDIFLSYI